MLHISRWKAAAILFTVLFVSAMAIPNFLPEKTFRALPKWAQHRVVLGIEYQGGSRVLMEVDADMMHKQMVEELREGVRNILREAKVSLTQAPVVRGRNVEVRIRESDFGRGFMALHVQLVLPYQGEVRAGRVVPVHVGPGTVSVTSLTTDRFAPSLPPHVTIESVGGGLVRLAVAEPAIRARVESGRQSSINILRRRIDALAVVAVGASIEPRGTDRVEIVLPGVVESSRLFAVLH